MEAGKVPTTPTTASVIAGIQVQEAVKHLHGKPTLAGKGFIFNGLEHDSYTVEYVRKQECYSHESFEPLVGLKEGVNDLTLRDLLARACRAVGQDASIEFNNDILHSLRCLKCGTSHELFMSLGKVGQKEGRCPTCGQMRDIQTLHGVSGEETFLDRTIGQVGVPPFDIVAARSGTSQVFFEFSGDAPQVLGPLHQQGVKVCLNPECAKR
jgi:adenylyltransferase/sulfurtransferase